jgi:hypothetical protein
MHVDSEIPPARVGQTGVENGCGLFNGDSILRPLATQAGLFVPCRRPILRAPKSRVAYVVCRLSTIFLSTSSVQHFGRQVYKLSATKRGCPQVEYSSTLGQGNQMPNRPGDNVAVPLEIAFASLVGSEDTGNVLRD